MKDLLRASTFMLGKVHLVGIETSKRILFSKDLAFSEIRDGMESLLRD